MSSPAIVIAIVALVAAMSGAALAGPSAKKVTTKKVKKIADKEIAKAAPGLSVAHAGSADSASNATTAANATQAQNAGTANGVKPIKVNFQGPPSGSTTLVDQGGVKIDAGCMLSGHGFISVASTADNGTVYLLESNPSGSPSSSPDPDFDNGQAFTLNTNTGASLTQLLISVDYRGADGTTVTGQVLLIDQSVTGSGQCVGGGTLFLGSA